MSQGNTTLRALGEYIAERIDFTDAIARTKQSFRDECDINMIMARWKKTGTVEHMAKNPPTYGDFQTAGDYQQALNSVLEADQAFDALPAHIRDRMDNDQATFMTFMSDPANQEEAVSLGLSEPKAEFPAQRPEPADPPPQGAAASEEVPSSPS